VKPLYNGMLPPRLVSLLFDIWPEGRHVVTVYGERVPDREVWRIAREDGLVIVTKDHDDDASLFPGPPPQVVRLLLGNATVDETAVHLRHAAPAIDAFTRSDERRLLI